MTQRSTLKKRCLGITVSLLLFALIGEVSLRRFYPALSCYGTEMWRYAMEVKRLRDDPALPFDHRPNAHARLYGVDFATNGDGGRDAEWTEKKPANTYRIAFVGDSITVGWGVKVENSFPEVVEKSLNQAPPSDRFTHYDCQNFGIGNFNTVMEYNLFKESGLRFKPDLIALNYYINDAQPTPLAKPGWIRKHSYLLAFLTELKTRVAGRLSGMSYIDSYNAWYKESAPGLQNCRTALQAFVTLAATENIPLVVFVIPEQHRFDDYPFPHVTQFVRDTIGKGGTVVDLLDDFKGNRPTDLWVSPEDHHPNAKGHAIAANRMIAVLEEVIQKETGVAD